MRRIRSLEANASCTGMIGRIGKTPSTFCHRRNSYTTQVEVLVLICQEYTPGEISARLIISEKTFSNHRSSIIAKTGVRNNIGLYKYALQHGYF